MSALSTDYPTLINHQATELIHESDRTAVYRGHNVENGQPVVIKLMRNRYPSFQELVQFRNQYAISKNLDIEGIIKTYAIERYENRYALIMEDMGGISLAKYKQRASLSLSQFLQIAIQLADTLHYLHNQSIIHKDIKPANILIHPETQEIKLIDFSISTLLPKENQTLQTPGELEGTLAYISPEQTGRMNRGIDYRSDFYSLGVTFYELLVGSLPFTSTDTLELIHAHIALSPDSLSNWIVLGGELCPPVLSQIVMKLMAKNAEERYQSALGLKYDLEQCLREYQTKGRTKPFPLGQRDICDRFLIPEKLYGRSEQVQMLLDSFHRVAQGHSEIVLVAGFSGIGKTAIINELHKPIVKNRGYFIKGKFDQFNRNIPFSALVQALRQSIGQLLGESDANLIHWQRKILTAVGDNGQILIDVIPELEQLIGQQPPVPELSGNAAQNRFNRIFQNFIAVFAAPEHPLVLFLDDLQWADSASLNLIHVLMENNEIGHLLLLGAYRDNEVSAAHPLMLTLAELAKRQQTISTITLAPLAKPDINQLVAEVLSCTAEVALPLTEIIYSKHKGNPFFTTQFLKGLYNDGLIVFNDRLGYWQCDLTNIQDATLTEDVVQFMAERLQKLPEQTRELLKLAACIGNQFDLETLAIVRERSPEEIAAELWGALQEGMVLPIGQDYKFFQGEVESAADRTIRVGYRFLHDRIQQAAYSLIPASEKAITHYKFGQFLLQEIARAEKDERIFEIINHLNHGLEFIEDESEKHRIARLNLEAARKATKSIAYSTAVSFLNTGIQLLGESGWKSNYPLMFELHKACANGEYLQGNLDRSEVLANRTLLQAKSPIDRADIYNILIVQYTVTAQYEKAIESGAIALNTLGVQWHEDQLLEDLERELDLVQQQLRDREISSLIDLPEMELPEKRSTIQILHNLLPVAFSINQDLWSVLVVKMVNLSLQYGHISECCFGYSFYGVLVNSIFGDYVSGYEFGMLSLNLSRKFKDLAQESKACNILAAFLLHWRQPIRDCESINNRGYEIGLESGQLQFVGYIIYNRILSIFHSGKKLDELIEEFPIYLPVLEKIQHYYAYDITVGCQLAISSLISARSQDSDQPLIDDLEEFSHLETCRNRNSLPAICVYQILKAQILYLFDRSTDALESLESAREYLNYISGHFTLAEYNYYHSLALLRNYRTASIPEQQTLLERVRDNQEQLKIWAENCAENFQHKVDLIDAEIARNGQDKFLAMELYDRAIDGAQANGYIQDEALANELFAEFYLDWGRTKEAALYMQESYYGYAQWGATAKVNDLKERYPKLLQPIGQSEPFTPNSKTSIARVTNNYQTPTATVANMSSIIDFSSLLKASQTLAGEIKLDRLLSTLMKIILQNAGATKGALLLTDEMGLMVEAIATRSDRSDKLRLHFQRPSILLQDCPDLPAGLINYVRRTTETALLDAKTAQTQFAADNYLLNFSPQSLLCLPLLERQNLIGILYLENSMTADAFTKGRIELLDVLCAQAAISLTNAQLYQKAQQALQDLQNTQLQLVQNEKMATLGNLVAGVAHEINNPLGFIGGNVQILEENLTDLSEIIEGYRQEYPEPSPELADRIEELDLDFLLEDLPKTIGSMEEGVKRIGHISTSLRIFSRTDADTTSTFNLHEGLDSTLLILKYRLKANEERPAITIAKHYGDIPEIRCYPGQLNQVFMNLCANAIDALEESNQGKSFSDIEKQPNCITIATDYNPSEQSILVRISDNGMGMSKEVQAKLFEQGFTTKGVGKGTGLGMAIARQIVEEKHGGTINCQSELGKGTEFIISLPFS